MELMNNAKSELVSENICEFTTSETSFDVIWFADAHLDSRKSKVDFLHETLKANPKAYIVFGGDNHDLMQGRMDKRSEKSADKINKSDYWNELIRLTRSNIVDKYKDRIICWNRGNHETSVLRNLEFDYLDALLDYGNLGNSLYTKGWIIFSLQLPCDKGNKRCYPLFFQHAPPSGGNRSKGMLSVDLLLAENPDAKAIITEHIHQTWIHLATIERLDLMTRQTYYQNTWVIQAPTLKAEHEGKKQGFYHEKIKRGAVTVGAIKLSFSRRYSDSHSKYLDMTPSYISYYT